MNKFLLVTLLLLTFLMSCTVQKRKHQNGFYVNWSHKKTEAKIAGSKNTYQSTRLSELVFPSDTDPVHVASANKEDFPKHLIQPRAALSFTDTECDIIVMRNGEEVRAKVTEITSTVIKYKRCDMVDGPLMAPKR